MTLQPLKACEPAGFDDVADLDPALAAGLAGSAALPGLDELTELALSTRLTACHTRSRPRCSG